MPKFVRKNTLTKGAQSFGMKPKMATNSDVFGNRGDPWFTPQRDGLDETQTAYDAQNKAKMAPPVENTISGRIERQDTKPKERDPNDKVRKRMQIIMKMKKGMGYLP